MSPTATPSADAASLDEVRLLLSDHRKSWSCRSLAFARSTGLDIPYSPKGICMLQWAVVFFIIAIVSALFGFSGVASDTAYIGKILAVIGIVLALVSFVFHRRTPRE